MRCESKPRVRASAAPVVLCYACHAMTCYAMLCHAMPCYAMLCYAAPVEPVVVARRVAGLAAVPVKYRGDAALGTHLPYLVVSLAEHSIAAAPARLRHDPVERLVGQRVRLGVRRRRADVARARALRDVVAEAARVPSIA